MGAALSGLLVGGLIGASGAGAWTLLSGMALTVWLPLSAALLGTWWWLLRRLPAATAPPPEPAPPAQAPSDDHWQRLQRRAHQLDQAEQLVDVGSFDWLPVSDELHWSEQHFRLWGYEPGSVQPSFELFRRHLHPDDVDRVTTELQAALEGRSRYDCRHRVQRSDGSVRHVRARGEVFFDAQGKARRMIGAVLDISDAVQAEASLRMFEFVLDAITDPVSVLDDTLHYRLANAAWLRINERGLGQTLGQHLDTVYPGAITSDRRQALQRCLDERTDTLVRGPSPSPGKAAIRIETRYFPFQHPAVPWQGAVMVSRDVTEDEAMRSALAASVDCLSLTLNAIGDAIFATEATSPDEPVLFANEQLRSLWRIRLPPGQPLTARVIIEHAVGFFRDPQAEVARIESIIAGNEFADDRLELNDGRVLMRRCRPASHEPRTVRVWVFRDITGEVIAQRSLAQAEARQRTLLAAFPGFIWVFDQALRLVYINPTAAAVFHPLQPQLGMSATALFGRAVLERVRPSIELALAGQTLTLDWHRPSRSGRSPDDMLIKLVPGQEHNGQHLCYAFGIDISSLKQAEAALVAAKNEAERANRAKTQFLSNMSHELRTPLNAVIGFSQVLEQNGERNLSPRQLRHVVEIRRAGAHLLALISDLLDLARIEAGRTALELGPVALSAVADDCLHLLQPQADRQGRRLERMPCPAAQVMADPTRLKQVLLNLLSNAIKYNREDGSVTLQWQRDGPHWLIEVHDQGPGLSADEQALLFRPFERLGAAGGDVEGTGIGLALSRHLVQLMQGEIGVRSEPGQGSCFWVRLQASTDIPPPRALSTAPSSAQAPRARPSRNTASGTPLHPPPTWLYIDDNTVNLALVEGLFEEWTQWRLITSTNPVQALDSLRERPVAALLVDLQMPVLDGFQVMARLQDDPATRHLPVVAISADATAATRQRCRALGFADYVTKPIDADRLLDVLSRALPADTPAEPPAAGLSMAATPNPTSPSI